MLRSDRNESQVSPTREPNTFQEYTKTINGKPTKATTPRSHHCLRIMVRENYPDELTLGKGLGGDDVTLMEMFHRKEAFVRG